MHQTPIEGQSPPAFSFAARRLCRVGLGSLGLYRHALETRPYPLRVDSRQGDLPSLEVSVMWLFTRRGNRARKSLFGQIVGGLFYRFGWYSSGFVLKRVPASPFRLRPRVGLNLREAPLVDARGKVVGAAPFVEPEPKSKNVPAAWRNQNLEVRAFVARLPAGLPLLGGFPAVRFSAASVAIARLPGLSYTLPLTRPAV